jgi:hypothetical protein
MANIFKPRRSNVVSSIPTTSNLADGEMAVNSADKKIFIREGSEIIEIANSGSSSLGIATAGGTIGTDVILLDFRGSGISTVTVSSGIATINIESGGGGSSTPDISPVMMAMIF